MTKVKIEGLNAEDTVLIASSSKEVERLPIERMCRYRELVEQLMKNRRRRRVIFSCESMNRMHSDGISQQQKTLLKMMKADFRRQTKVDGINDKKSTNQQRNLECYNRNY